MTGEHIYHIELNQMVRTHYDNAISVFGGPHPTYCPEMIEKEKVDAICRGEGEIYFPELIEKLEKGQDIYETKNFWFKKSNLFAWCSAISTNCSRYLNFALWCTDWICIYAPNKFYIFS